MKNERNKNSTSNLEIFQSGKNLLHALTAASKLTDVCLEKNYGSFISQRSKQRELK